MADTAPLRRSRRAASLTAEVLWNIQIEDDRKANNKPHKKNSTSEKVEAPKRGRKRASGDKTNKTNSPIDDVFEAVPEKKVKIKTEGSSKPVFSSSGPLGGGRRIHGKLTASVAPLIKTSSPTVAPTRNNTQVAHSNPILLLPVSLQTNHGRVGSPEVGGLPVITLQDPSELLSCFGINNTSKHGESWGVTSITTSNTNPRGVQIGIKRCGLTLPPTHTPVYSMKQNKPTNTGQDEPLNLSVGGKPKLLVRPVQQGGFPPTGIFPVSAWKSQGIKVLSSLSHNKTIGRVTVRTKVNRKPGVSPDVSPRPKKCPSPDYACSSPDVDDVHRDVRHTCNRPQIKLRNKAAPPRGSAEYDVLVEEQRRAQAVREVEAKRKALKLRLMRTSPVTGNSPSISDWSSVVTSSDETNNGWEWVGSPYTALVYSVESGKYVKHRCFPGMRRQDDGGYTVVMVRDCVFLLAGEENEPPYLGKVTSLWEKGDQMMISLLWFYRPEHTEDNRPISDEVSDDELFASRHQDEMSVACVEDRCHVVTYSEYCRAQARLRRDGAWLKHDIRRIVPPLPAATKRRSRPRVRGEVDTDPNNLFFCRRVYDVKMRRVLKSLPVPTSMFNEHGRRSTTAPT
ncbi:uncharacterized protein LOC100180444 [Ciona intestinalis]